VSVSLWILCIALAEEPEEKPAPPVSSRVVSVYDGDTFTLETGDKVRLRWVNTPELRPAEAYGIEARDAAAALIDNRTVTLVYDTSEASVRDGYGRVLAGARVGEVDLSVYLLERGLGHVFLIPPDDGEMAPLLAAQRKAQRAGLGIWSTDRYQGALHITSFHANARGNDRENVNGEYLRVCNVGAQEVLLSEYRLKDAQGHEWSLPQISLPVGHTVKIHSGRGEHQSDPAQQLAVYLQSDTPVWNNDGDRAMLLNSKDEVVDAREHKGSSR